MKILNSRFIKLFFYFLTASILFPFFSINLGFSLKPFYILTLVLVPIFFYLKIYFNLREFFYIVYLFFSFASLLYAENFNLGLRLFLAQVIVFIFYFITKNILINSNYKIDIVMYRIFLTYILISLSFFVLFFFLEISFFKIYMVSSGITRFSAFLLDPNFAGYTFAVILFWSLLSPVSNYFLSVLAFISLILTFSISSFICLLIGFFYYVFFIRKFASQKYFFSKKLIYSMMFNSALVFLFIFNSIIFSEHFIASRISSLSTGSGRFELWRLGYNSYIQSPFFGVGIHNIGLSFGSGAYLHNTFLEVLFELGPLGFFFFIAFFISLFISSLRLKTEPFWIIFIIITFIFFNSVSAHAFEFFWFMLALFEFKLYNFYSGKKNFI